MSLIKQLWIAILLVTAVAFGGSTLVGVLSARHYLEQQLQVKNIDNATALALSLSHSPKDPVTVELQVAAQFDAGHYKFIRIVSPTGQTLIERVFSGQVNGAPRWFTRLVRIEAAPGQAQIQDGWKQYGTLFLASHEQYAYRSLWNGTLVLLAWFAAGALITGIGGTLGIRQITRPLGAVVRQADAIAERRFMTNAEPRTPELRSVVRAMNSMVERLKAVVGEEATRLNALRQEVNLDAQTGLAGREHFLSHVHALLNGEGAGDRGTLVLVRLKELGALHAVLGRQRTDALVQELGELLKDSCQEHPGRQAGRTDAHEFALVCPTVTLPAQAGAEVHARLSRDWLPRWTAEVPDLFHLVAIPYRRHQAIDDLLNRAQEVLAHAETLGPNSWCAGEAEGPHATRTAAEWQNLLTHAMTSDRLRLAFRRVVSCRHLADLHYEGVARLQLDEAGPVLRSGEFMPMAAHLHLAPRIDLHVVKLAIRHLHTMDVDVAIHLSPEAIADFSFRHQLLELLEAHPDLCRRLLFEVTEYGVFQQIDAFHDLVHTLKPLGCRVGIEYFGQRFAEGDKLASLGLDYIKIHPSYLHGIANSPGNQEFLKGLCTVARHFGVVVIALGVASDQTLRLLASLGFDGATRSGVE